ncbi:hypothetical protein [Lysinibacillus sp. NPDC056185]|uniref:hypothetical protein n=1 Tax=Lysinibacillus sp. NPDC056185 TaxID=3345739 RepID=UPI0039EE8AD6
MGISIYYSARRKELLTDVEKDLIKKLISEYSVQQEIEKFNITGEGYNWTSFEVYDLKDSSGTEIVFEGSTQLPDNMNDAIWEGVQHWSALLSQIRCAVLNAEWYVAVEDYVLEWDEEYLEYDLSK